MKLGIKNKIDKAVEGASEKAGQVKRGASDGFNRASELAKDFADKAGSVAKDVVSKANSGVNSGVEAVGEKIQYKKAVMNAASEIDKAIKAINTSISPNMDAQLSNQLELLLGELKGLSKMIKKNEADALIDVENVKTKLEGEKNTVLDGSANSFNRSQLMKHYNNVIDACEEAIKVLKEIEAKGAEAE